MVKIGEMARKVGMATSAIRFYEEAGLIPEPPRTSSGYREYDPTVLDRLAFIRAGQAVGLTLGQLRGVLQMRDRGEAPCDHVADLIDERISDIDQRIDDLKNLRRDLVPLASEAKRLDPAECTPESVCRILTAPTRPTTAR